MPFNELLTIHIVIARVMVKLKSLVTYRM